MPKAVNFTYTAIYQTEPDGMVIASVVELPGAMTQARTHSEAEAMLQDAVLEMLRSYREDARRAARDGAIIARLRVTLEQDPA